MNNLIRIAVVSIFSAATALAQSPFDGAWTGLLEGQGEAQPVVLVLRTDGGIVTGKVNVGPISLPVSNVRVEAGVLRFDSRGSIGAATIQLSWVGELRGEGLTLSQEIPENGQSVRSASALLRRTSIAGLAGQKFILRGFIGDDELKIKQNDLGKPLAECGQAVEVLNASYSRDTIRLDLEGIGTLITFHYPGTQSHMRCIPMRDRGRLTITNVSRAAESAILEAILSNILVTPEAFLARHGIALRSTFGDERAAEAGVETVSSRSRIRLMVQPTFSDQARRERLQGSVTVSFGVGTDGRTRSPRIVKELGLGLDQQALRALELWRLDPAYTNGVAVTDEVSALINFSLR